MKKSVIAAAALLLSSLLLNAQPAGEGTIRRYEPDLQSYTPVEGYILPDVLTCNGGKAVRRRVTIWLDADEQHGFEVLVHLPANHDGIHALWWDDWLDYIKYAKRIFNVRDGAISH